MQYFAFAFVLRYLDALAPKFNSPVKLLEVIYLVYHPH